MLRALPGSAEASVTLDPVGFTQNFRLCGETADGRQRSTDSPSAEEASVTLDPNFKTFQHVPHDHRLPSPVNQFPLWGRVLLDLEAVFH